MLDLLLGLNASIAAPARENACDQAAPVAARHSRTAALDRGAAGPALLAGGGDGRRRICTRRGRAPARRGAMTSTSGGETAPAQTREATGWFAVLVASGILASRIAGFVRQHFLARYLGLS